MFDRRTLLALPLALATVATPSTASPPTVVDLAAAAVDADAGQWVHIWDDATDQWVWIWVPSGGAA